ncbi:MAG: DUF4956 domain-containing protein [Flavobacteriales bacterium]|jgi:hypothetical protein|nr:DUF4956 domain-containing protein [Flavobacteriales bacterium]MBL7955146.1 DUF4956 domain-containing protein [Flavobacteriales bacterium]
MKVFGMPLIHADMWELLFKFGINTVVLFVLIRLIYYPIHRKKDYLFTYFLFNTLIFFLCVLLNSVKLSIGFAFGLFAIFGVLRYRTEQISIKDMTYLFATISVAVINALASKKVSLAELLFTDGMILLMTYALEHVWLTRHEAVKMLIYERIDLIKPQNRIPLFEDLYQRLGVKVSRVEIGKIDLLKDTAELRVYYFEDEQSHGSFTQAAADDGDD